MDMKKVLKTNLLRWIAISIVVLANFMLIQAAPLKNIPQHLTQPDGATFDCYASGDEFFNYLHDAQGNLIIQDEETGYYTYATYMNDEIVASKYIVGRDNSVVNNINSADQFANTANLKLPKNYKSIREQSQPKVGSSAPTKGTIDGIVVFVKFAGEEEFVYPSNQFDSYYNGAEVSLKGYYKEVSGGQLCINTHFFPNNEGGAYSYTDVFPREYYMPYNKKTNPMGFKGGNNSPERFKREEELFERILKKVDRKLDSSVNVDRDNDGKVDAVTFIVSGNSTGWSNILWPHCLTSGESFAKLQGKGVDRIIFQIQGILVGDDDAAAGGVGVLAHEMFHGLGAPDLYRYYSYGEPVGPWDLMSDQDPYAPQHMTTYMKTVYGGWVKGIPAITKSGTYSLSCIASDINQAYCIATSDPDQFYVLEYRKKQGNYESSIKSEGLLVYRANISVENGNRNGPPDEVYIYRPNDSDSKLNKAPLSPENGKISYSKSELFLADDSDGTISISNVKIVGDKISFTVTFYSSNSAENEEAESELVEE